MSKIKYGTAVKIKGTSSIGNVMVIDELLDDVEVKFSNGTYCHYKMNQLEMLEQEEVMFADDLKVVGFEELGSNIGKLVEKKQLAYGNSIDKTYKLMQVFLEGYDNGNNTYTIPKSLLKHILLQVRIIDKQNRIFSNPDGDLMEENPYADTVGYGLLGMRMVEDGTH